MKKKVFVWATLAVMSLGALTGCQKKVECDWCGETKVCKEYNDGEDVWNICDDCMKELEEIFED